MEKKIANIGKDKNKTTVCKHAPKSNFPSKCCCQTMTIVNIDTKLNIGRALIKKYLLSENKDRRAWNQDTNGGWSK